MGLFLVQETGDKEPWRWEPQLDLPILISPFLELYIGLSLWHLMEVANYRQSWRSRRISFGPAPNAAEMHHDYKKGYPSEEGCGENVFHDKG